VWSSIYLLGGLIYSFCVVLWLVPTLLPLFFFGVFFYLYIFHILFLLLLVIFGCMFAIYFCLSAAAELLDFSDEFRFSHKTFYCWFFFFLFCLFQIYRYAPLTSSYVKGVLQRKLFEQKKIVCVFVLQIFYVCFECLLAFA